MPIGIGTAAVITGSMAAAGTVTAAEMQRRAANKAGKIQSQAADASLDFEKSVDERQNQQYEEERARKWEQEDEDRKIAEADRQLKIEQLARDNADRDRRVSESQPFVGLGTQSANSLKDMLSGTGGGQNWMIQHPPPQVASQMTLPPTTVPLPGQQPTGMVANAPTLANLARAGAPA